MEKVSLDYNIIDLSLIPLIDEFLKYKYKNCNFNNLPDMQFVAGDNKQDCVDAINDIRFLCTLAVGIVYK